MRNQIFRRTLWVGVALTVGDTAWAQAAPSPAAMPPAASAQPRASPSAAGDASSPTIGDIIVTARRRDEKLQNVPVSITALSSARLDRSNVQTISDIRTIAPGLTFASEGGKDNVAVTLRGIGQIPTGEVTPGVVTYFANVPLASLGSNVPTYDIANVQVLKGPQGTLFGRNTLGGAVLIAPQAPTQNLGGYVEGTYGNYDYREIQGALNVPIVKDVLAIRLAGQIRRRDSEIYAINGGNGFNNVHEDSARVSVLFTPTDWLKNSTIFDYFKADEYGAGYYLLRQNFSFGALFGPGAIATSLDQQAQSYLAQQKADFFGAFEDSSGSGYSRRLTKGVTNDTSATFGAITLHNIFGYRSNRSDQLINTAALGPTYLPGAAVGSPVDVPFTVFHASAFIDRHYLTNEFQVLGNWDRFNVIVGGFYSHDASNSPNGSTFDAFTTPASPASVVTANVTNTNYAVFTQTTYKVTSAVSITGGLRYSWDEVSACGGAAPSGVYVDDAECRAIAATPGQYNVGVVGNKGSAPSWTIGVDWKVQPSLLLYIVSRRGYRGVNVNTPLFQSPYTTGAMACGESGTSACPDLRPYQKTGEEKLTDVEVGEKWDFMVADMRARLNTAAYYSKYSNALQFLNLQGLIPSTAPDNPTNASIGVNAADLSIYGLEMEASINPTRNFTLGFNGALTHVNVDKVTLPPITGVVFTKDSVNKYSPNFSGTVSANWTMPFKPLDGDVTLNGDFFRTAAFGGQYGQKLPGYNLANARLDWKGISHTGLELSVFVRNLTNEHYFAAADVLLSSFPVNSVAVGDPRTYGVSATYRF